MLRACEEAHHVATAVQGGARLALRGANVRHGQRGGGMVWYGMVDVCDGYLAAEASGGRCSTQTVLSKWEGMVGKMHCHGPYLAFSVARVAVFFLFCFFGVASCCNTHHQ